MTSHEVTGVFEKISKAIVGVFNINELQERILDLSQNIFEAEACSLFLFDEEHEELHIVLARGFSSQFVNSPEPIFRSSQAVAKNPKKNEKVGITGWIAHTGQSFMANSFEELSEHPHWRGIHDKEQLENGKKVSSFYGVPLKVADHGIIGVLKVENKRRKGKYQPFIEDDAYIFDILASHIAIAIANARSIERIERQQVQLQTITNALQQVVSSLSEELPMQHLLEEIVDTTAKILSAEACVLFLKDESRDVLVERAGVGYVAHLIGKAEYHLIPLKNLIEQPKKPEDRVGLTAWIAITGQPFLARNNEDLRQHPHWRGRYDPDHYPEGKGKQCNSFLGVPLLVSDEVVGVLKVENKKIDEAYVQFTDQDRQVFETLAKSIAIAVGKVRQQRIQREQAVNDAMYRISAALAGRFEIEPLLEEIVKVGAEIFNAEACVVFLKDSSNPSKLVETKGKGYVKHLEGQAIYDLIPPNDLIERPEKAEDRVGLTAWIAITGQPFLARNNEALREHPHWRGTYDRDHYEEGSGKKCTSFLGLPLRVGEEILGVLKVENKKDDDRYVPFDERDQQLFQVLANSAAIAIQNTRDFQELQETQQLASIGRSATAMAHRMRTPLQDIRTAAELLVEDLEQRDAISSQNRSDFKDIIEDVKQADDAIERVRIAAKQLKPKLDTWNIEEIIKDGFTGRKSFSQQFQRRNIQAEIKGLENIKDFTIHCDKNLVEEAIANLVGNALEAIKDGGRITITVKELENEFHIDVRDNGPGIDKKLLNLFEPFNTTKKDGLGLGLFIVKRNIEIHGGTVSNLEEYEGACFRIEIPRLYSIEG